MRYNPKIHHRKSIRLKNYDYSQAGLYFVTIVTQNRECLFGDIVDDEMVLNDAGDIIENVWLAIPKRYKKIRMHEYCVMPNHFHALFEITVGATLVVAQNDKGQPQLGQSQGERATTRVAPTVTVGDIVGVFKSIVTNEYIRGVKNNGWRRFNGKLWQRNYWEHIIRNENEHQQIVQYIIDNPKKWALDKLNNGSGNHIMEPQPEYPVGAIPCGCPNCNENNLPNIAEIEAEIGGLGDE